MSEFIWEMHEEGDFHIYTYRYPQGSRWFAQHRTSMHYDKDVEFCKKQIENWYNEHFNTTSRV